MLGGEVYNLKFLAKIIYNININIIYYFEVR